jgi:ankyrin repeat protein
MSKYFVFVLAIFMFSCAPTFEDFEQALDQSTENELIEIVSKLPKKVLSDGQVLNLAIERSRYDIIDELLDRNVSLEHVDELGNTPLANAYLKEEDDLVKLLISKGANINSYVHYKNLFDDLVSYLFVVKIIRDSSLDILRMCVDQGINFDLPIMEAYETNISIGYVAAAKLNLELFQELIAKGMNIDSVGDRSILEYSIEANNLEVANFLVDYEKNPQEVLQKHIDVWKNVFQNWSPYAESLLDKLLVDVNFEELNFTNIAIYFSGLNVELAMYFVDKGLDVNQLDENGFTMLDHSDRLITSLDPIDVVDEYRLSEYEKVVSFLRKNGGKYSFEL